MLNVQRPARFLFYSVWAVVMTALTYILGAVSLKVLRRRFGRAGYWSLSTVTSVALYAGQLKMLALAFFSLVVLIGVFSELEEMDFSFGWSSFFTLVINGLIGAGTFAFWVYLTGPKWSQTVLTYLEAMFKPLTDINPQMQIKYFELMLVLPSIVLILWMGSLYVAILLESRLSGELEKTETAPTMRQQLSEFRLHDAAVWAFVASLLGSFGGFGGQVTEALSANVLNVCFMLFFFQGIAVVSKFFARMRVGPLWQTLFMLLIVVYLFLFVSILGLADYWVDFRGKLAKKPTEQFNREA